MTPRPVHFSEATQKATKVVSALRGRLAEKALLVRDTMGRLAIALNVARSAPEADIAGLQARMESLGAFASKPGVYTRDDFFDPDAVFSDPSIVRYSPQGDLGGARLLDRQITGHEWIRRRGAETEPAVPRIAFYGFKGGVGRSTALAVLAYQLAKSGKKVLLVDLDLESPGSFGIAHSS